MLETCTRRLRKSATAFRPTGFVINAVDFTVLFANDQAHQI